MTIRHDTGTPDPIQVAAGFGAALRGSGFSREGSRFRRRICEQTRSCVTGVALQAGGAALNGCRTLRRRDGWLTITGCLLSIGFAMSDALKLHAEWAPAGDQPAA